LYVLISEPNWIHDPLVFIRFWEGGLVFYGGVIAAFAVLLFLTRRYKLPVWKTLDVFAPALSVGHALGRLGCFAAGCCYGRMAPESAWYTVIFPVIEEGLAPAGIPLYATQLYESAGEACLFTLLVITRLRSRFVGQTFLTYITLYPLMRFCLEFFRGDFRGSLGGIISTSQAISLVWIIIAAMLYLRRRKTMTSST
jgi:phosphatidylglycerol:prolipoprotein diacylglycerol transferase